DGFAIKGFLNGEMGHRRGRGGAVPVFFARREPDDVAGAEFLDRTAPALGPAKAGSDDQGLAEGMGMPGGAGAGLEGHAISGGAGGRGGREERIDTDGAGEVIRRAAGGGLGASAFNVHGRGSVSWKTKDTSNAKG